jgi:hypothetical protein
MLASVANATCSATQRGNAPLERRVPIKKKGAKKTVNLKLPFNLNSHRLTGEHDGRWDHESPKTGKDGCLWRGEARKKVYAKGG